MLGVCIGAESLRGAESRSKAADAPPDGKWPSVGHIEMIGAAAARLNNEENVEWPLLPKEQGPPGFAIRTPPGTRTLNPLIKSQLLCQLS